jgi:hypothetical protein
MAGCARAGCGRPQSDHAGGKCPDAAGDERWIEPPPPPRYATVDPAQASLVMVRPAAGGPPEVRTRAEAAQLAREGRLDGWTGQP